RTAPVEALALGHVADSGEDRARGHGSAEDARTALARPGEPHEETDERRLARAVRAEEAVDRARRQGQIDAVDRPDGPEVLVQADRLDGGRPRGRGGGGH